MIMGQTIHTQFTSSYCSMCWGRRRGAWLGEPVGAHSRAPDPGLEIRDWKSPQEGPASEGSGRRTGRELGWRAIVREL